MQHGEMGLTVSSSIINRAGFAALMHLYHDKRISIIPSTKGPLMLLHRTRPH